MDTIFALSSGRPPAAIAVVRVSGPLAPAAGERLAGRLPQPRRASLRSLRDGDGELLDQALVVYFPAGNSVTGEPLIELHCHGGRAVVNALLDELGRQPGLREALPGEFTRRAFANGRMDLTEAEGLADLLEAETEAQRRSALAIASGSGRRQVEDWRERLVLLSARAEAAIDYVGEDEESGAEQDIAEAAIALHGEFAGWLGQPRAELLRQGIRVVLAGPPNAGKSSLLNALVGSDRAIVTAVPGTTRDAIEVAISIGGLPFSIVDTAGLRDTSDQVERLGVAIAEQQVESADILCWLGDPSSAPSHCCLLLIESKADLRATHGPGLQVSSVTSKGVGELRERLVQIGKSLLPVGELPSLNARQAGALSAAADALGLARPGDLVLTAEALRQARAALDRLTGRVGVEDVLDSLFNRFCLGK